MEETDEYTRPVKNTRQREDHGDSKAERKTVEMNGKAPERLPSMAGRTYPPGILNGAKTFREYYTPIKSEPKTLNMADVMKNRHTFNMSTANSRASGMDTGKKTLTQQSEKAKSDRVSLMQGGLRSGMGVSAYDSDEMGIYTKSKIETVKLTENGSHTFLNSTYNTVLLSILATSVIVFMIFKIRT